jgi:TetR/AcrR family transcriptional repressor of nem operon
MRYSPEHKAETHARIVRKASVRLRERGAHGVGVADLMKEAGLTHGGFYAHFDSREALVVEAFGYAIDRSIEHWRKLLDQLPPQKRLAAIVDGYLSAAHRDDVGHGCAVPALGAEIARESAKTRKAFAAKLQELIELFAEYIVDVPAKTARRRASAMLATLTGTLVMARLTGSGELSDDILSSGREVALAVASGGGPAGRAPVRAPAKKSAKKAAVAKR